MIGCPAGLLTNSDRPGNPAASPSRPQLRLGPHLIALRPPVGPPAISRPLDDLQTQAAKPNRPLGYFGRAARSTRVEQEVIRAAQRVKDSVRDRLTGDEEPSRKRSPGMTYTYPLALIRNSSRVRDELPPALCDPAIESSGESGETCIR
ncbi:MAG: hypothetical protein ACTHQQ_06270 [Solirubrobacteraceae bacterium]